MGNFRFDWRWIALFAVLIVLANSRSLPWPIITITMGGGGIYLLVLAWQVWNGGNLRRPPPSSRVTYWRGQRIETSGPPRRAPFSDLAGIGPALIYGLIGLALTLGAVVVALNGLGIS
ncbi:MAG: hypothetical protein HC822_18430 [Oscillochloris sp.]|nr:hypothetical protein [Oscillochloris sp.]